MYHYTYGITHKFLAKKYIGTRSCQCLPKEDIGVKYFSSSQDKEFIEEQKLYPDRFLYEVIEIFNTREEASALEIELHSRYDVGLNIDFYNRSKQTSDKFDVTGKFVGDDSPSAHPVYQLDPDTGEIIARWGSIVNAKENTIPGEIINLDSIISCCQCKQLRAGGYAWCYKEDYSDELRLKIKNRIYDRTGINHPQSKGVLKIDKKTGKILEEFPSLKAAQKSLKTGDISRVVTEQGLTAGGFIWLYKENYSKMKIEELLNKRDRRYTKQG